MIISSFDRYGEVRHFDPGTGALSAAESLPASRLATNQGDYAQLDDTLVLLYRDRRGLQLRIGSTLLCVADSTSVMYRHVEGRRVLEVSDRAIGDEVIGLEYT